MDEMTECEVWIQVDGDGNYAVATTQELVGEFFDDDFGIDGGTPTRIFKMTLKVPTPKVQECEVIAPAEKKIDLVAKFE
jgi:hypothetical protein